MDMTAIRNMVTAALILHNVCVSDRVMGDVNARYDPSAKLFDDESASAVGQPTDLADYQVRAAGSATGITATGIGATSDSSVYAVMSQSEHWSALDDVDEHMRLRNSLMDLQMQLYEDRF